MRACHCLRWALWPRQRRSKELQIVSFVTTCYVSLLAREALAPRRVEFRVVFLTLSLLVQVAYYSCCWPNYMNQAISIHHRQYLIHWYKSNKVSKKMKNLGKNFWKPKLKIRLHFKQGIQLCNSYKNNYGQILKNVRAFQHFRKKAIWDMAVLMHFGHPK